MSSGEVADEIDFTEYDVAKDLSAFQRDLLCVLATLEEPSGLRVAEPMEELYREEINRGRLYSNLDRLDEKGLIDKRQRDKRTNEYVITPRGVRTAEQYREFVEDTLDA